MSDLTTVSVPTSEAGPNAPDKEGSPERPSWLPEKFKTPEEMAQSYKELESKLGQSAKAGESEEGDTAAAKPITDASIPETPDDDAADKAVADAGLDINELQEEYVKEGKLTDATYERLASKGISKDVVDDYISAKQAVAQQQVQSIVESVGGPEQYRGLIEWAQQNLNAAEQAAYSAAVSSGGVEQAKLAVEGLQARYTKSVGSDPKLLGGKAGANIPSDTYTSIAQMQADMASKEYKTDPAFRAKVAEKLRHSNIL